jgi:hypothetical protein
VALRSHHDDVGVAARMDAVDPEYPAARVGGQPLEKIHFSIPARHSLRLAKPLQRGPHWTGLDFGLLRKIDQQRKVGSNQLSDWN